MLTEKITMMNENRPGKIKTQDRIELEKFIKFFALKTIQAVVQSRLGVKKKTKSKANGSTHDWFNVTIEDNAEIQEHAKKSISGQTFLTNFSMCIEISLETTERDKLVLETWCLCMKERFDPSIKVSSIYYRMSLLLKSIIAVARITPAYKLSGRQSSDSYIIKYLVYFGTPQVHHLGEGYLENKIGEIVTPLGILLMSVSYRTKMTITPQKVEKESPFMVKSDYFKPDMNPKRSHPIGMRGFHLERNTLGEEKRISEGLITNNTSCPIANGYHDKHPFNSSTSDKEWNCGLVNGDSKRNSLNHQISPEDYKVAGAFAPSTKFPDPASFPDLLPDKPLLNKACSKINNLEEKRPLHPEPCQNSDTNANLNINNVDYKKETLSEEVDYNCNSNDLNSQKLTCSGNSECEDFVMVELRPPFADSASNNDLGAFFRECQCAPPLASFATQPTLEEQVTDIANQLAQFETSMHDFDSFVDSICQVDTQK